MELMQANAQWSSRPDDERFLSLDSMLEHFTATRRNSKALAVSSRAINAVPAADHRGLAIEGPNGNALTPTHWSFGQLCQLAEAPAAYLRSMPADIAADCINYGLRYKRDVADVGVLLQRGQQLGSEVIAAPSIPAFTGPNYGRIWNADVIAALVKRFGDGVTGQFKVPGEFGKPVPVTKSNTTLYAGDRDMFVFLADESRPIEIGDRRDGKPGALSRGFFMWNSEVGSTTFGVATFLFDYVCCNRIVWGASAYKEIRVRHTSGAPDRFLQEVTPALRSYAESSTAGITDAIASAKAARLDDVGEFLAKRFGKSAVAGLQSIHQLEEGRPIATMWDAVTAVTAKARSIPYQGDRVALERQAGELLDLAAA